MWYASLRGTFGKGFLNPCRVIDPVMPTLFRFVRTVALAAALGYAVLWSLANLVEPRIRPMSEPIESRILRDAGRQPAPAENASRERGTNG